MTNESTDNRTCYEKFMDDVRGFPARSGPHLTFAYQCAIFFAARHYPNTVIAEAFGVTPSTISVIANCIENGRYQRVKEQWETLGEELFVTKYITDEARIKLTQAMIARRGHPDGRSRAAREAREKS